MFLWFELQIGLGLWFELGSRVGLIVGFELGFGLGFELVLGLCLTLALSLGLKLGLGLMLGFELGLRLWLGLGLMPTVPVYMVVDKFFPFFYNNYKHTKMFVLPLPFPPKMLSLIVDIILNNSCNLLSPDEDMIRPRLRRMKIKSNEMHAVIA